MSLADLPTLDSRGRCAPPKSRPRRRSRAEERAVIAEVRARCVERDGRCRFRHNAAISLPDEWRWGTWSCAGPSEWAHLRGHRRSQTRRQAPRQRHTTAHTAMLCQHHHRQEEAGILQAEYLTARGCDGPMRWVTR